MSIKANDDINFEYINYQKRVSILSEIKNELKNTYALWDIKKYRKIINPEELFKKALHEEKNISDSGGIFSRARKNVEFHDRVLKIGRSFCDSHLNVYPIKSKPSVLLGFTLAKVKEGLIVKSVYKNVLKRAALLMNNPAINDITIGDLLISIDRIKPYHKIKKLFPYTCQSSIGLTEMKSIRYLTERQFYYPKNITTTYQFLSKKKNIEYSVKIPWQFRVWNDEKDFKYFLKQSGFIEFSKNLTFDEIENDIENTPPVGIQEIKDWYAQGEEDIVIRTGLFKQQERKTGYLQILSFVPNKVQNRPKKSKQGVPFLAPIRDFIYSLKKMKMPLIIDIRFNGGGIIDYGPQIMSMIAKKEEVYSNSTEAYRLTPQFLEKLNNTEPLIFENFKEKDKMILEQLKEAKRERKNHTYSFRRGKDIKTDSKIDGYKEPVVVLISPECSSACHIFAMILKQSKRVTLVGSSTNGSGAGYYADDFNIFKVKYWQGSSSKYGMYVPNGLFGFPGDVGVSIFKTEKSYLKYNSENRPVIPHIHHESQVDDYFQNSKSWIDKSIETIF